MPTNSDYDGFFAGIGGIPLFTYGMITTTILVLAYMTSMEPDLPITDEVIEEVIDTTGPNSTFMTSMIPNSPLEENIPVDETPINSDLEGMPSPSEENPPIEDQEEIPVPPENMPSSETKGGKKIRKTKRRRPTVVYL